MWVFFFFFSFAQCVGVTQLVSGFLSERISQCVGVDLVCLSEFRSFLCCHLSPKPLNSFCLFIIVISFFFYEKSFLSTNTFSLVGLDSNYVYSKTGKNSQLFLDHLFVNFVLSKIEQSANL